MNSGGNDSSKSLCCTGKVKSFCLRAFAVLVICKLVLALYNGYAFGIFDAKTAIRKKNAKAVVVIGNSSWSLKKMVEMDGGSSLELSRRQHEKFFSRLPNLTATFPALRRFKPNLAQWAANIVNDEYAYIHIFKNGGTTIAAQTKKNHVVMHHPDVQQRKWFAVVRDPIDHFLSGWGEVGNSDRNLRLQRMGKPNNAPYQPGGPEKIPSSLFLDYDTRIRTYLKIVKGVVGAHGWHRESHSFPQVNFLINENGEIPSNLEIIGDLKELPSMLQLVGFEYDPKVTTGRNATANSFLSTFYPRIPDLLSNQTIRDLCDFLAIDYFMLDYPLPESCHDMGPTGYTNWTFTPRSPSKQQLTAKQRHELMKKMKRQQQPRGQKPPRRPTHRNTLPSPRGH